MDFARHQAARHVEDVDGDFDEPVQMQLGNGGDAAIFIVFAQEHAKPCRNVRRRRHRIGNIQARRIVQGDDQVMDTRIVEDTEVEGPGIELINLRNLAALKDVSQFVGNAM